MKSGFSVILYGIGLKNHIIQQLNSLSLFSTLYIDSFKSLYQQLNFSNAPRYPATKERIYAREKLVKERIFVIIIKEFETIEEGMDGLCLISDIIKGTDIKICLVADSIQTVQLIPPHYYGRHNFMCINTMMRNEETNGSI